MGDDAMNREVPVQETEWDGKRSGRAVNEMVTEGFIDKMCLTLSLEEGEGARLADNWEKGLPVEGVARMKALEQKCGWQVLGVFDSVLVWLMYNKKCERNRSRLES